MLTENRDQPMLTENTDKGASALFDTGEIIAHGPVHLDVTDLSRALAFWRDLVGLTELGAMTGVAMLGAGDRELIVLHEDAVRASRRGVGLYHVALHLPDEREFAQVLLRLASVRYPQAPTDHIFSKATYLDDPDGIGLELTLETAERVGKVELRGSELLLLDSEGRRRSLVEPLDTSELFSQLDDASIDTPLPSATKVGHVHLHVGDLETANSFYRDKIGFKEHMFIPNAIADLHSGGRFPHRLALNVWGGTQARQELDGTAGLRHFTIVARDDGELTRIRSRLDEEAGEIEDDGAMVIARDPDGNRFQLTA